MLPQRSFSADASYGFRPKELRKQEKHPKGAFGLKGLRVSVVVVKSVSHYLSARIRNGIGISTFIGIRPFFLAGIPSRTGVRRRGRIGINAFARIGLRRVRARFDYGAVEFGFSHRHIRSDVKQHKNSAGKSRKKHPAYEAQIKTEKTGFMTVHHILTAVYGFHRRNTGADSIIDVSEGYRRLYIPS